MYKIKVKHNVVETFIEKEFPLPGLIPEAYFRMESARDVLGRCHIEFIAIKIPEKIKDYMEALEKENKEVSKFYMAIWKLWVNNYKDLGKIQNYKEHDRIDMIPLENGKGKLGVALDRDNLINICFSIPDTLFIKYPSKIEFKGSDFVTPREKFFIELVKLLVDWDCLEDDSPEPEVSYDVFKKMGPGMRKNLSMKKPELYKSFCEREHKENSWEEVTDEI